MQQNDVNVQCFEEAAWLCSQIIKQQTELCKKKNFEKLVGLVSERFVEPPLLIAIQALL